MGNLSINPLIFKNLAYDPEKELVPVALHYKTAFFVTVGADSKIRTIKDLIAEAGKPGVKVSYASNAVGGPIHLGSARFIAVAESVRSAALPDAPTLEEAGGPKGIDALTWVALMAPAGTPAAVVSEINAAVNEALAQPDIKDRFERAPQRSRSEA